MFCCCTLLCASILPPWDSTLKRNDVRVSLTLFCCISTCLHIHPASRLMYTKRAEICHIAHRHHDCIDARSPVSMWSPLSSFDGSPQVTAQHNGKVCLSFRHTFLWRNYPYLVELGSWVTESLTAVRGGRANTRICLDLLFLFQESVFFF